ncbi:tetratricopeptide (TPR) repeat protein [Pseudoclavibacter chungangensis]|nr:tetratricopeptide (TPR) repeat protein [Pseudoclavibacter chungangensis]
MKPSTARCRGTPVPCRDLERGRLTIDDVAFARRRATRWSGTSPVEVAQSLHTGANRLGREGRFGDAVRDLERAIELWRRLAEADPDAFSARLARSLHAESVWLGADGLPDEAMRLSVEAVAILRARRARALDGADEELARALNGLGAALVAMGRPAEAVAPVAEAVSLRRSAASDGAPRRTMEFAATLVHLGRTLDAAGRHREALPALNEAEQFYRTAAEHDPGAAGTAHADVVDAIGLACEAIGDGDAAVRFFAESVDIRGALDAAHEPAPGLAASLQHLARAFGRVGRLIDAAGAADAAVRVGRRTTSERTPDERVSFAGILLTAAETSSVVGRAEAAANHAGDALGLLGCATDGRRLRVADAGAVDEATAAALRARAFRALSNALAGSGRDIEAARAAECAVDALQPAVEHDRGTVAGLDDTALALALHLHAQRLATVGRCLEAMDRSSEAVNLLRATVAGRPSARAELAVVLADHSARTGEAGHLARALEPVDEALGLLRDAPGTTPTETLAAVHLVRAERLGALGRGDEALADTTMSLQLLRDATGTEAVRPRELLANALRRLATLLRAAGRSGEAELADARAANVDTSPATAG